MHGFGNSDDSGHRAVPQSSTHPSTEPVDSITERSRESSPGYRDEERLETSQVRTETFRQIAENIEAVVWMVDAATLKLIYLSPAFESVFGRPRPGLDDDLRDFEEIIRHDHRERFEECLVRFKKKGSCDGEFPVVRPDGTTRWVWGRGSAVRNTSGRTVQYVGTIHDITDRRQHYEVLRESEDHYRDLVEHSLDLICTHDLEGRFLSVNELPTKILGYTKEELLSRPMWDFILPESKKEFQDYLVRIRHERFAQGRMVVLTKQGERRIWEYKNTLRTDGVQHPIVRGIAHDITERINAEWALRQSEEKFSKVFRSSPDAIVVSSLADGRLIDVNDGFVRMSGYRKEEVIGRTSIELNFWRNPADRDGVLETLRRGGEIRDLELEFRMKSGEFRLFSTSAQKIELTGAPSLIVILRDMTDRRALEDQLRHAQKMEAVGLLAGGVAHEFNNALVGVLGYGEMLRNKLSPESPLRIMAQHICDSAVRARDITARLLALSRQQAMAPQFVDVNQLINQIVALLSPLISADIELVTNLDPLGCSVTADPKQLEQVILNIALNARDAMHGGGKLELETGNIRVPDDADPRSIRMKPGRYASVRCADTGCGMEPAVMARVFEPFFTTKEMGKGSGLGLSTAYGIIKQMGGYIEVASDIGKGSTFTVYLPYVDSTDEAISASLRHASHFSGTVLLVEDDDVVRVFVRDLLRESGYRVLCAANGANALRLFQDSTSPIDLVLTDVVMPKMSGPELAKRLRDMSPELKVLYMTGYADEEVFAKYELRGDWPQVAKPFKADFLLDLIKQVLRGNQKA